VASKSGVLPIDQPPETIDVALQATDTATGLALVVERLAANPSVDVAKLEKIIELQERIMRYHAEAAFNVAFTAMQPEIPTIIERAKTDKTTYAPLEDIIDVVRPICARHGFSIAHRTEWPDDKSVKVFGILTHNQGHTRESEFKAMADQTGSKNAIQALASAVSYGKRYTTKDLLCIVTRGEDDDGASSEKSNAPAEPAGYDDWLAEMATAAQSGFAKLSTAWNKSKADLRNYVARYDKVKWETLRKRATDVDQEQRVGAEHRR
jgi:hypothetical protein